jgi:hypothetical protein
MNLPVASYGYQMSYRTRSGIQFGFLDSPVKPGNDDSRQDFGEPFGIELRAEMLSQVAAGYQEFRIQESE